MHNHPSGDPTPSRADIEMTRLIIETAKPLGGTRELLEVSDNVVRVTTTASFASEWLMPCLPDFQSQHPLVEIWVEEGKEIVNPRSGGCDLAIRMGPGGWPGVHAEPLMDDRLFPVCTRAIAEKLKYADDLVKVPLLHDDDPQAQWVRWLKEAGIEVTPARSRYFSRGARFASSSLLLRATAAGQGVALARERLAESWLDGGKLVRPFAETVELGLPIGWSRGRTSSHAARSAPSGRG